MEKQLSRAYEFGPFRLDACKRLLREGETVPLTVKAFEVSLALVEQHGRLLDTEALLKMVWPDSFVEEKNLADNISRMRKSLGDGVNGRNFIQSARYRPGNSLQLRRQRVGSARGRP